MSMRTKYRNYESPDLEAYTDLADCWSNIETLRHGIVSLRTAIQEAKLGDKKVRYSINQERTLDTRLEYMLQDADRILVKLDKYLEE